MKKLILCISTLAILAIACQKLENNVPLNGDEMAPAVKMITETISGSRGVETKATIADTDASFAWTAGDNVAVHVSSVSNGKFVYTSDEGASGAAPDTDNPAKASFTVVYPADYSRDAFAVYPSTIVAEDGLSGSTLNVTLPPSYLLAEVSGETGETSPCPMIADNTGASWSFSQLCSLLRLTVNGIPADATGLVIRFPGKKVNGAFSIASVTPGTSTIATGVPDDGEDKITVSFDAGITTATVNIPLPTGDYEDVYITPVGSTTKVAAVRQIRYTATAARAKKLTAALASISVSATKQVIFAPGNLQYLGNTNGTGTWRFADHQYDFLGDGPTSGTSYQGNVTVAEYTKYNASADRDVARDLFGWGTSGYSDKNPYMTSSNSGDYYNGSLVDTDYDWGVYHSAAGHSSEKIVNGGDYSWRLFTADEWAYVIRRERYVYTREDSPTYQQNKPLFAPATVMGVKGILLFPDNWDGSLDRSIKYGNESSSSYNTTNCDAKKWASFEEAGCVFLPAAHARKGSAMEGLNTGNYWASTINGSRGCCLQWSDGGTVYKSSSNTMVRYYGQSVRLIRDL
jgi:hypothetical protein